MSDTCWFCEKRPPTWGKSLDVPLYRNAVKTFEGIKKGFASDQFIHSVRYESSKASVPRCSVCAGVHKRAKKIVLPVAIVGAVIGFVVEFSIARSQGNPSWFFASLVIAILGAAVFAFLALILRRVYMAANGTAPESKALKHLAVTENLRRGWKLGTPK